MLIKMGFFVGLMHLTQSLKKVFVVHGEDSVCDEFTECLKEEYGYDAMAPYTGGSYDLIADRVISEGVKEKRLEERQYTAW